MPTDGGEPGPFEERLEVAVDYVLSIEGSAFSRGEDEPCDLITRRP